MKKIIAVIISLIIIASLLVGCTETAGQFINRVNSEIINADDDLTIPSETGDVSQ